jgi:hypothetical protein
VQCFKYLRTRRGDPLVAFIEELKLLQYLGLFVQCWSRRRSLKHKSQPLAAALMALVLMAGAAMASGADTLKLTLAGGRVTLVANGVTVQQVLAEWSRVGGTQIDNIDAAPSEALELRLTDATEEEALQVLLRNVNFVAVERPLPDATAGSRIARIVLAPAGRSAAPPSVPSASAPPATSLVQPIIGLDGLPIPDDQANTQEPSRR